MLNLRTPPEVAEQIVHGRSDAALIRGISDEFKIPLSQKDMWSEAAGQKPLNGPSREALESVLLGEAKCLVCYLIRMLHNQLNRTERFL